MRAFYTGWYQELVTELPRIEHGYVYPMSGAGPRHQAAAGGARAQGCDRAPQRGRLSARGRGPVARRPTIRDVAREAPVSTVTVSRVANAPELVKPATRARVEAAMRRLGYVPNAAAQSMRTNVSRTIGFLVPDLTNYPNAAVAKAAEATLAAAGYAMLLTDSDHDVAREARFLRLLRSRQVDGILLYLSDEDDPSGAGDDRRARHPGRGARPHAAVRGRHGVQRAPQGDAADRPASRRRRAIASSRCCCRTSGSGRCASARRALPRRCGRPVSSPRGRA